MIFANANEEHRYREQTHKKTNDIPPVWLATFKCASCKTVQLVRVRRAIVHGSSRFGYRCARCVESSEKAVESEKKGCRA